MRHCARMLLTLLLLSPGVVVVAQEGSGDWNPSLTLEPETDGTIWVDFYLPREPADPASVSAALAEMMGERDPEVIEDYYDGGDDDYAGWSDYWWDATSREGMLLTGELDLEPLRAVLGGLGYTALDVSVYRLPAGVQDVRWNGPVDSSDDDSEYSWATLPLNAPVPTLSLAFGYTPATLLRYYLPVPLLIAAAFLFVAILRRHLLGAPDAEVGYACYICNRTYYAFMFVFWGLLAWTMNHWKPLEPLEYASDWDVLYPVLITALFFVAVGSMVAILARVYLLPVYLRLPGATWTRRDFAAQAAWGCAFFVVVVAAAIVAISQLRTNPTHALAWVFAGTAIGAYVYLRLLMAMGIVLQSLDEGELFGRAKDLAESVGVSRLRGTYMMYQTKSPVLNAMAATGLRLVFTDVLLRNLTRNEVDAVIGHELTHFKLKHPERLRRAQFLAHLLGIVVGMVVWVMFLIPVAIIFPTDVQQAWELTLLAGLSIGLLSGTLLYTRICRKFEFEADAGAVAITGDPEALITGLSKVTRLNFMPMHWRGTWAPRFLTHPSTYRRAERIAQIGKVPPERLDALVAPDATVGEGRYDIPHSAGRDRAFTTQHKMRVQQLNLLSLLLVTPLVPLLCAFAAFHVPALEVPALAGFLPLLAVTFLVVVASQNRSALRGFRGLARHFRALNPVESSDSSMESPSFVGYAPNRFPQIYDGFTNWDVGLTAFDETGLHYRGDALRFSIPRDAVQDVSMQRLWFSLFPTYRILVRYTAETGKSRYFGIACVEASSQRQANRKNRALFARLQHWHSGGKGLGTLPDTPYSPPPLHEIEGLEIREVYRFSAVVILTGCIFASGFALGVAAGLPTANPLMASALGVGVIAAGAAVLALGPIWLAARGTNVTDEPEV